MSVWYVDLPEGDVMITHVMGRALPEPVKVTRDARLSVTVVPGAPPEVHIVTPIAIQASGDSE